MEHFLGMINIEGGWDGERTVSSFAELIFERKIDEAKKILSKDSSLIEDPDALELAVYIKNQSFVEYLINSGFKVTYNAYYRALSTNQNIIQLLQQLDLSEKNKAEIEWSSWELNNALFYCKNDFPEMNQVEKWISMGAKTNLPTTVNYSFEGCLPIHFVSLRCPSFSVFKKIVQSTSDINSLTLSGKTPLRLVLENEDLKGEQREKRARYFISLGATCIPQLNIWDKLRRFKGVAIKSTTL